MADKQRLLPKDSAIFAEFDFEKAHLNDEFFGAIQVPLEFQSYACSMLSRLEQELPGVVIRPRICITVRAPFKYRSHVEEAFRKIDQDLALVPGVVVQPCGVNAYAGQI